MRCHELAHYSHSDTRIGVLTHRNRVAIRRVLDRLGAIEEDNVSLAVMRRQELNADRIAAEALEHGASGGGARIAGQAIWLSTALQ